MTDPIEAYGHTLAVRRALAGEDTSWKELAACRGSDVTKFFPGRGESCIEAKAVCATCPVTFECADYGARYATEGIWGGLLEWQRRSWRKTRGIAKGRGPARHGTVSNYGNGCRCDECRAAKTDYARKRRANGLAS